MTHPQLNVSFSTTINKLSLSSLFKILGTLNLLRFSSFYFMFIILSCSPTEPVVKDQELTITVDAEVVESWVTLTLSTIQISARYIILRDTVEIFDGPIFKKKFLFRDQNLIPNKTYTYSAFAYSRSNKSETAETYVTTMDTTKSNFIFSSSIVLSASFTQCRIWDKKNYWIVGEYYADDSLGTSEYYTILSYENGHQRNIAVKYDAGWTNPITMSAPTGFWAFNKNNVWFSIYNTIHWTGGIGQIIYDDNEIGGRQYKLYGFDENDIYIVREIGNILKLTDSEIKEIIVPENYKVLDLWGDGEKNLGLSISDFEKRKFILMFLKDGEIVEEINYEPSTEPGTLWFKTKDKIYVAWSKVNVLNRDASIDEFDLGDNIFIEKIRGTDINNIFAVTWQGEIFHFNGIRWKLIFKGAGKLDSLCVTDDLVLVIGKDTFNSIVIKIIKK